MSPRSKRARKILSPPLVKGFKPFGQQAGGVHSDPVYLHYEEYEAIRLSDYEGLSHLQASEMMAVSRPTFTRIYASALQKMAMAFVEGRQITIEGGKIYFDSEWFHCSSCECFFNNPEKGVAVEACPLCGNHTVTKYGTEEPGQEDETLQEVCICPVCRYELTHKPGHPCRQEICPQCNINMQRKRSPTNRKNE